MPNRINRRQIIQSSGAIALAATLGDDRQEAPELNTPWQRLVGSLDILRPDEPMNADYPDDPVQFINDVLGYKLWKMQEEIVYSVWESRYTSVASCHGIGKSLVSAAIVITWLHLNENSIVVSTAPTGRQVEHILWRNIRQMYRTAKKPLLGPRPPLTTRYDIAETWFAMGFKPQDTETDPLQGFHSIKPLALIDEAAGVAPTIIDGMMAMMTTDDARFLMIGNPTSTSGPFYDSHHSNEAMYRTFVVAWPDTPNYNLGPGDKRPIPGLIDHQWVEDVIQKYGEESPYVRSRVFAEWVSAEDVLVPLHLLEEANNKPWSEEYASEVQHGGLDVARDGKDKTVLTLREGNQIIGTYEIKEVDFFAIANHALDLADKYLPGMTQIKIDEIGLGAGMVDVMRRLVSDLEVKEGLSGKDERWSRLIVTGVNFSRKAYDPEKYMNQRCEAYGELAQRFRDREIRGNIHAGVIGDLSDLRAKYGPRHTQPIIEPKDDFRKRVGHSPDHSDSVALAFYNPPPPEIVAIGVLSFGYAEQNWGRL